MRRHASAFLRGALFTLLCLVGIAAAMAALVLVVYGATVASPTHLLAGVVLACSVGGCVAVAARL